MPRVSRRTISLRADSYRALRDYAVSRGRSMSGFLEEMLDGIVGPRVGASHQARRKAAKVAATASGDSQSTRALMTRRPGARPPLPLTGIRDSSDDPSARPSPPRR